MHDLDHIDVLSGDCGRRSRPLLARFSDKAVGDGVITSARPGHRGYRLLSFGVFCERRVPKEGVGGLSAWSQHAVG
jgi:hypothetical protein